MRVLLPPSETKRDGGAEGSRLALDELAFPELARPRRAALAALARLSRSVAESTRVLGLGATQRHEIERNRAVRSSPTMAAIDRYTGVLYDALEAETLSETARAWLGEHVVVQSALFGMTGALDAIPAYRLSASTRMPGLRLTELWAPPIAELTGGWRGLTIDLRSEAYSMLGPVEDALYVRVVTRADDGEVRALNHWNKTAKGRLVRALAQDEAAPVTRDELVEWASAHGLELTGTDEPGELRLLV